jgi:opacity protein-like surface antigen
LVISRRTPRLAILCWLLAAAVGLFARSATAQVVPAAIGPARAIWAGAEYSNFKASFPYGSNQRLEGVGAFFDYHLTPHFGAEAEARLLRFNRFNAEAEDDYLAGLRYSRTYGRFQPYAQGLVGIDRIQFPFHIGSGNYLTIAPAAGVNYRVAQRWALRGAYEYQFLPGSPNIADEPEHRLTPNGFSIGVAYRVFR